MVAKKSNRLIAFTWNCFLSIFVILMTTNCAVSTKKQEDIKKYIDNNECDKAIYLLTNKESKDFIFGRCLEIDGKYKEAYDVYYNSIKLLKNLNSERAYNAKSAMLISMCYCLIKDNGDYRYVNN